jgi:hypothetical protein
MKAGRQFLVSQRQNSFDETRDPGRRVQVPDV